MRKALVRVGMLMALAAALFASQGCAAGRYFQYRGEDFLDMIDVGITVTSTPQIGLYWNSLDILVAGYSNVDGHFIGWGGGRLGFIRHYNYCYGLIVSSETVGWGNEFRKNDPKTLHNRIGGLLGLASFAGTGNRRSTPDYTPACVHFVPHLGWVGLVWNAKYTQMLDFIVGWTTLDIGGDDGREVGHWPWTRA